MTSAPFGPPLSNAERAALAARWNAHPGMQHMGVRIDLSAPEVVRVYVDPVQPHPTTLDASFGFRREDFEETMPVDWFHNGFDSFLYVHLYRFLGQVLFEMGILPHPEPIGCYRGHAVVVAAGKKMSKHYGNAVTPDQMVDQIGADAVRLQLAWAASPSKRLEWSKVQTERACRFLGNAWQLIASHADAVRRLPRLSPSTDKASQRLNRYVARAIRRVTAFIEDYRYSAAINELSGLLRELQRYARESVDRDATGATLTVFGEAARTFVLLLAPFTPHVAEELNERLGGTTMVALSAWPVKAANGKKGRARSNGHLTRHGMANATQDSDIVCAPVAQG